MISKYAHCNSIVLSVFRICSLRAGRMHVVKPLTDRPGPLRETTAAELLIWKGMWVDLTLPLTQSWAKIQEARISMAGSHRICLVCVCVCVRVCVCVCVCYIKVKDNSTLYRNMVSLYSSHHVSRPQLTHTLLPNLSLSPSLSLSLSSLSKRRGRL